MIRVVIFFISFIIGSRTLQGQSNFWESVELESITSELVNTPESGIFILVNDMVCKLCISEISSLCTEFTAQKKYVIVDAFTKPYERVLRSNEIQQLMGDNFEIIFLSQKSKTKINDNGKCKKCVQSPHLLLYNNKKAKFICYNQLYKKDSLDQKVVHIIKKFFKA